MRSYLIHRLSPLGADAKPIVKQLESETDLTIRRALLLSLSDFSENEFTPHDRRAFLPLLQGLYRTDADPGLHAASEWLLRTWKQEAWLTQINDEWAKDKEQREKRLEGIQQLLTKDKEKTQPQWFVNGQGQTFVVIPGPKDFLMGSPPTEAGRQAFEPQHKKRIGRTFAIAAKAVTMEQYRRFAAHYGIGEIESYARTADSPVIGTDWFQAVAYCNWLSQQEGLPESEWCYEPRHDPKALSAMAGSSVGLLGGSLGSLAATSGVFPGRTNPQYDGGMKLAENYLQRTGYRLPTEAEMEFATRAGALTSRYYGETEELLSKYAWYQKNAQEKMWPVGSLKPNDLGLFDVLGNVLTWCQESYQAYPQGDAASDDKEVELVIVSTISRVLRGGSFLARASIVRSANRYNDVPTFRYNSDGFRLARTLPLGSSAGRSKRRSPTGEQVR